MGERGPLRAMLLAMTWDVDVAYRSGLDLFGSVVGRFPVERWGDPAPCAGWRALDVLGHVGATTAYGVELLSGGTPTWEAAARPGDAIEGDPAAWWDALAQRARALTADVDLTRLVDTPAGSRTVGEGLSFPAMDLFIHAWDLGCVARIEVEIPAEAVAFTRAVLASIPEAQLRSPGVFAPEVAVPSDASPTETFVAWTGRDPRWHPASV